MQVIEGGGTFGDPKGIGNWLLLEWRAIARIEAANARRALYMELDIDKFWFHHERAIGALKGVGATLAHMVKPETKEGGI